MPVAPAMIHWKRWRCQLSRNALLRKKKSVQRKSHFDDALKKPLLRDGDASSHR